MHKYKPIIVWVLTAILIPLDIALIWSTNLDVHTQRQIFHGINDLPTLEWAIIPGASVNSKGDPSPALRDRLMGAIILYQAQKVSKLLLSGDRSKNYDEVGVMEQFLLANGVPSSALVLDPNGTRTFESIRRAKYNYQVKEAIIISQGYHLPRSIYIAENLQIKSFGYDVTSDKRAADRYDGDFLREYVARSIALVDVLIFRCKNG